MVAPSFQSKYALNNNRQKKDGDSRDAKSKELRSFEEGVRAKRGKRKRERKRKRKRKKRKRKRKRKRQRQT